MQSITVGNIHLQQTTSKGYCGDSVGSTGNAGNAGNAGKAATVTAGDDTCIWWWFIVVYSRLSGLSAVIFAQQTRGSADETVATSVQGRTKQSKNNSLHLYKPLVRACHPLQTQSSSQGLVKGSKQKEQRDTCQRVFIICPSKLNAA